MHQRMTMEQICAAFPGEWVLFVEPEVDEQSRFVAGLMVFHHPDRDEVYRKARDLPAPRHVTVRHAGPMEKRIRIL